MRVEHQPDIQKLDMFFFHLPSHVEFLPKCRSSNVDDSAITYGSNSRDLLEDHLD